MASQVRSAVRADVPELCGLFESIGLSEPHELSDLADLLWSYFDNELGPDHQWLACDDDGLVGAAYYALDSSPERSAPGTWNLYFIGVLPNRQGLGYGSALIDRVENTLAAQSARDLLVETSGVESFEATRSFYRAHGYTVIARVADAYKTGDDKVIFRKRLTLEPA